MTLTSYISLSFIAYSFSGVARQQQSGRCEGASCAEEPFYQKEESNWREHNAVGIDIWSRFNFEKLWCCSKDHVSQDRFVPFDAQCFC